MRISYLKYIDSGIPAKGRGVCDLRRKRRLGEAALKPFEMRSINNLLIIAVAALMLALTGCGSSDAGASQATRVATQTPFIIYVPVTTTPEPATPTALPTVTPEVTSKPPTRTPTKTAVRPTATKAPPTPPGASGPSPTAVPACTMNAVTLRFPDNGAPRSGKGGSALDFQWTPFQPGETESQIGYRIDLDSKRFGTNQHVNGDVVYISHNGFLRLGQHYIYDPRATAQLAGGDDATVTWWVTVVKTTGSFDDQGHVTGSVFNCSPPSERWIIQLQT